MRSIIGHFRALALHGLAARIFAAALVSPHAAAAAKPKLLATIAQLGEPMARILDGCADVETLLGPGVDPHAARVTPRIAPEERLALRLGNRSSDIGSAPAR